jgi:hypothetical protein
MGAVVGTCDTAGAARAACCVTIWGEWAAKGVVTMAKAKLKPAAPKVLRTSLIMMIDPFPQSRAMVTARGQGPLRDQRRAKLGIALTRVNAGVFGVMWRL